MSAWIVAPTLNSVQQSGLELSEQPATVDPMTTAAIIAAP
jgi:hypothetical protein